MAEFPTNACGAICLLNLLAIRCLQLWCQPMGPLCLWQCFLYPLISCNQICILFQLQNVICRDCKIPTILPWPSASATCMVLSTNYQWLLYIGIINSIELVSSSARVTTCICCKFSPCITLSPSFGLFQSEKWQKKGVPGAAQCGSVDQNMPLYTEKKENLLLHQKCNFCEANFTGILLEMKT